MPNSTTPLFDKLCETLDFIWYRVVPLFKPEDFQADDEKHMNAKDWFIYKFISSSIEGPGLMPTYERTRFFKIARLGEGLPDPELMHRELLQAYLACSVQVQAEFLRSELHKALFEIRYITNIIIYDLPQLGPEWIKQIQNAVRKAHDEVLMKQFIERTGKSELDMIAYRDHHWPNAIKYLKCLYELAERIFIYVTDLREFSYWDSQSYQKSQIIWAPTATSDDQMAKGAELESIVILKPKRVNAVATDKRNRLIDKYNLYIGRGHNHKSAVKALVHDFRLEYSIHNTSNRTKQISRIIKKWKEQLGTTN